MHRYTIVPAPTNLCLRPIGVEHLADALLALNLATMLGAEVRQAVGMGEFSYSFKRDQETGYVNGPGIRDHALRLSRTVGTVLDSGRVAVVLGGDCSILR